MVKVCKDRVDGKVKGMYRLDTVEATAVVTGMTH